MGDGMNTCNFSTNLDAMADHAKPEAVMIDLVKPEGVMSALAKPESGRLLFWERVGAFSPPSGAGFCTSERAECLCASYTIDAPALRFRRNTRHTFPEGSHHMFRGTSLLKFRRNSLLKFFGTSLLRFRGNLLGYLCCDHSLGMTLSAKHGVVMSNLAKPEAVMIDLAKPEAVMIDLVKTEVVMIDLVKPEGVMSALAKPESGRLLFWERVGAFRPPSGAGFCTSERAECLCASYTIDAPALRFRRNLLVSFRSFE